MVHELEAVTVQGRDAARQVMLGLTWHHQWFQITPLPDDEWLISVKAENKDLLAKLVARSPQYVILPKSSAEVAERPEVGDQVTGAYVMGWLYVDCLDDSLKPLVYSDELRDDVIHAAREFYSEELEIEVDDDPPLSWSNDDD